MNIEFREKTYEKAFFAEIARRTDIFLPPDQMDEEFLGFDDAFFLPKQYLFGLIPRRWWIPHVFWHPNLHDGVHLSEVIDHIGHELSHALPPLNYNLFVQYKRPEVMVGAHAREWSDWAQTYFRYEITPHQQDRLAVIEQNSGGRAVVIYASPAFATWPELSSRMRSRTIIEGSNIANVGRLVGHRKYAYVQAGAYGKAYSEPTEIRSVSIEEALLSASKQEGLRFSRHMKKVAGEIYEAVNEDRQASLLFDLAHRAITRWSFPKDSLAEALLRIRAFEEAFDISYYPMGKYIAPEMPSA